MSAKSLKLDGGLTDLLVNDSEEFLAFTIQTRRSFKGDPTTQQSMLAMLNHDQQHLLMLYLRERLG